MNSNLRNACILALGIASLSGLAQAGSPVSIGSSSVRASGQTDSTIPGRSDPFPGVSAEIIAQRARCPLADPSLQIDARERRSGAPLGLGDVPVFYRASLKLRHIAYSGGSGSASQCP